MIDVGIAGDENDVDRIPTSGRISAVLVARSGAAYCSCQSGNERRFAERFMVAIRDGLNTDCYCTEKLGCQGWRMSESEQVNAVTSAGIRSSKSRSPAVRYGQRF